MTVRTHALTIVAQTPTSSECQFKNLYLTSNSIMAVGHLLWDFIDHDTRREQYSVTYVYTELKSFLEIVILGGWG